MDQRRAELDSITHFITNANKTIDHFLQDIGWNREKLLKDCKRESPQHTKKDDNEELFPESFLNVHPCSVKINKHVQAEIVRGAHTENFGPKLDKLLQTRELPSSHKDLITNFTREERLALYQYAVNATPKQEQLRELELSFKKRDNQEMLTPLAEIAAYRRDIRRRNQKYRIAKNPLTYQEEMRNLIQLQTEALSEYLAQCHSADETVGAGRSRSRSNSRERKSRSSRKNVNLRRFQDLIQKKRRRSRSRSRSGHRHKSKKSKRDGSKERISKHRKHKSRH